MRVAEEIAVTANPEKEREHVHIKTEYQEPELRPDSRYLEPVIKDIEEIKQEYVQVKDRLGIAENANKFLMEEIKRARQVNTYAPPPPRTYNPQPPYAPQPPRFQNQGYSGTCHYCHQQGHFMGDCPIKMSHLEDGKVKIGADGRLRLPDGRMLGSDPTGPSMKDKAEEYATKQVVQQAYGYMPMFEEYGSHTPGILPMPVNLQGASMYTNRIRDQRDEIIEQLSQKIAMGTSQFNTAPPPVPKAYAPRAPEPVYQEPRVQQPQQDDLITQLRNLLGQVNTPPVPNSDQYITTRMGAEGKKDF
jgi:hypothetical protein